MAPKRELSVEALREKEEAIQRMNLESQEERRGKMQQARREKQELLRTKKALQSHIRSTHSEVQAHEREAKAILQSITKMERKEEDIRKATWAKHGKHETSTAKLRSKESEKLIKKVDTMFDEGNQKSKWLYLQSALKKLIEETGDQALTDMNFDGMSSASQRQRNVEMLEEDKEKCFQDAEDLQDDNKALNVQLQEVHELLERIKEDKMATGGVRGQGEGPRVLEPPLISIVPRSVAEAPRRSYDSGVCGQVAAAGAGGQVYVSPVSSMINPKGRSSVTTQSAASLVPQIGMRPDAVAAAASGKFGVGTSSSGVIYGVSRPDSVSSARQRPDGTSSARSLPGAMGYNAAAPPPTISSGGVLGASATLAPSPGSAYRPGGPGQCSATGALHGVNGQYLAPGASCQAQGGSGLYANAVPTQYRPASLYTGVGSGAGGVVYGAGASSDGQARTSKSTSAAIYPGQGAQTSNVIYGATSGGPPSSRSTGRRDTQMTQELFDRLDVNHDGVVTREEFRAMVKGGGVHVAAGQGLVGAS